MSATSPRLFVVGGRAALGAAAATLLTLFAADAAQAQTASNTIWGCYPKASRSGPGTGQVYRINKPVGSAPTAPLACTEGDVEFSWNAKGEDASARAGETLTLAAGSKAVVTNVGNASKPCSSSRSRRATRARPARRAPRAEGRDRCDRRRWCRWREG
jgi:hypothetical protein